MGLLDNVENKALASMLGSSSSPLATGLLQMLNNQPGGLAGLVQSFHDKGMGGLVQSWVGSGQNLPISADQISHVLGSDQVKQLAAAAGISPDAAGSTLAKLLPALIDHATPNGQMPQQGNLMDIGKSLLQSLSNQTHA
jgi:uncharacterized protein YidB (DUF937 family)